MSAATDDGEQPEWEDCTPDWMSGNVVSVQRHIEDPTFWQVEVAQRGSGRQRPPITVLLDGAPDHTVLRFVGSGSVTIAGTCGDEVELQVAGTLTAVHVNAPLAKVTSIRDELTLVVPPRSLRVEADSRSLTLNKQQEDEGPAPDITVLLTCQTGGVKLAGTAPVQDVTFSTTATATLSAPLAAEATVVAAGQLRIESEPTNGVTVRADDLFMVKRATPGTYESRVATFEQGVSGSPESPAVIEQRTTQQGDHDEAPPDTLTLKASLTHAQVKWRGPIVAQQSIVECPHVMSDGDITVSKDVKNSTIRAANVKVASATSGSEIHASGDCTFGGTMTGTTVEASGQIHVSTAVEDGSHLKSRSDDDFAITVGGQPQQHPVPRRAAFDRDTFENRSPLGTPSGRNIVSDRKGSIRNSHVVATEGGVSCRTAAGTTFDVASLLRIQEDLEVTANIDASTVRVQRIAVAEQTQHHLTGVGHLIVNDLTAHGHIGALTKVTCNWLRPPRGEDGEKLDMPIRIDAEHIEIVEGLEGRPHLNTSCELAIKSDGDAPVTLESTGGHISTYGYTIDRACLAGEDVQAKFRSPVRELHTIGRCTVDLGGLGRVERGRAADHLTLLVPSPSDRQVEMTGKHPNLILKDKESAQNQRQQRTAEDRATLTLGAEARIEVVAKKESEDPWAIFIVNHLATDGQRAPTVTVTSVVDGLEEFHFEGPRDALPTDAPALRLEGALVARASGSFRSLSASSPGTRWPRIVTEANGDSIYDASGSIGLGVHRGTLYAKEGKRSALVIREVEEQAEQNLGRTTGKVLDVDITHLGVDDLDRLQPLEIIEPTARSMRDLGKREPENPTSDVGQLPSEDARRDLRALAERARRVNQLIERRAVAGSSRAAARWAESRLHHRSIKKSRLEWWVRWVPWTLGYGQRPEFPLATLATAYLLLVATRLQCWAQDGIAGFCTGTPMDGSPWFTQLASSLSNTLQQPFTLVQFGRDADALFARDLVNLGTSALLGIPFLFFVIALKNYLSLKNT